MAIVEAITITSVARTKGVSQEIRDHFGRELTRWVNEKHGGNQTHAGTALGVTQSHISAMMSGDRGPGLNTLILMRGKTNKSIDELLGLGPLPDAHLTERLRASLDLEVARFRAEAKRTIEEAGRKLAEAAAIDDRKRPRGRRPKRTKQSNG